MLTNVDMANETMKKNKVTDGLPSAGSIMNFMLSFLSGVLLRSRPWIWQGDKPFCTEPEIQIGRKTNVQCSGSSR